MLGRFPPPARLTVVAAAAILATSNTAVADPPDCLAGAADRSAVVCAINAARADAGRDQLRFRPSLAEAARTHSGDMVARRYFAHTSPDGEGPADRAGDAGYMLHADSWRVGEILLWYRGGPLTAARAVDMWLASASHRRILLSRRYRDVGVGVVPGAPVGDPSPTTATTVTVNFGRRR